MPTLKKVAMIVLVNNARGMRSVGLCITTIGKSSNAPIKHRETRSAISDAPSSMEILAELGTNAMQRDESTTVATPTASRAPLLLLK